MFVLLLLVFFMVCFVCLDLNSIYVIKREKVIQIFVILLLRSTTISLGFTILGEIFAYVTVFKPNHWGSHIPSLWMVHTGCVFVAGIHPSITWLSGSFESMRWNACVYRLDLGLYSHPKEFFGNGVRIHGNSMIIFLGGGLNPHRCIKQDSESSTLPAELFQPLQRFVEIAWNSSDLSELKQITAKMKNLFSWDRTVLVFTPWLVVHQYLWRQWIKTSDDVCVWLNACLYNSGLVQHVQTPRWDPIDVHFNFVPVETISHPHPRPRPSKVIESLLFYHLFVCHQRSSTGLPTFLHRWERPVARQRQRFQLEVSDSQGRIFIVKETAPQRGREPIQGEKEGGQDPLGFQPAWRWGWKQQQQRRARQGGGGGGRCLEPQQVSS